MKALSVIAICLFLSSCTDIMRVQKDYISDRDDCYGKASSKLSIYSNDYSNELGEKESQRAKEDVFCECMKERNWCVSACGKITIDCRSTRKEKSEASTPPQQPAAQSGQQSSPTVIIVQPPAAIVAPPNNQK